MKLILASTSPYRKELLSRLKMPFEVVAPEVDETPRAGETPEQTALRLAIAKARAIGNLYPDALVIGSDQVATLNGEQIGKPHTHENATRQLRTMRGKTVTFHTALCLYNSSTENVQAETIPFRVRFRGLSDEEIERYLTKEQPYNCAGSAKSEGLGIALIEQMSGDDPNALIGLPLIALVSMLRNEGVVPF